MGREVSLFIIITIGNHAGCVLIYHYLPVPHFNLDFLPTVGPICNVLFIFVLTGVGLTSITTLFLGVGTNSKWCACEYEKEQLIDH